MQYAKEITDNKISAESVQYRPAGRRRLEKDGLKLK